MMSERARTLCFSGHRHYTGTPADEIRLAAALRTAYADGCRTFISGVATGFDLAAGEAVVRLRDGGVSGSWPGAGHGPLPDVRLVCAVPFARQAAKYSVVDRARYDALLDAADVVNVLSERYFHGCYYHRDDWMVEHSARIICWFDGSGNSRSSGGTRYTVRRAVSAGVEVVNLFHAPGTLF